MPWDADGNPTYNQLSYNYDIVSDRYNAFQDREGNIWDSVPAQDEFGWTTPKLILSAEVAKDPYISTTGIAQQDPSAAQALYDLKKSNPTEFYNQIAPKLTDKIYQDWRMNNNNAGTQEARNLLEGIKEENPQAYYTAKLTDLGRNVGWQIGQNTGYRNAPTIEQIKGLVPNAMKAGLSAEQIDSIVGNNINAANAFNQSRIANEAASGNFWTENILGAAKVGALGLGAAGLDAALNAGATGMNGALQSYLGTTGGAFVPAEGFSATLPGFANAAGSGSYLASELAGPTYGELGITGVEGGFAGPTYAEMGYTGLNQGQAIAAADAASFAGITSNPTTQEMIDFANARPDPIQALTELQGMNPTDLAAALGPGAGAGVGLLANAGNLLKGASLAKGLLGAGKNPAVGQPMGIQPMQQAQQKQYAGVDYSPILNLLAVKSPERTRTSLLG